ncbi:cation-dependent mannose-6-phosphate receptor [Harpegnathos saltator]|nr:cation-dependent mannose-6-phosphate receptor [Harpegnathos saltator]
MCSRNGTLFILVLFLMLFYDSTSLECTQLGPCICRLPNGYYYNLTSLADKEILEDEKFNLRVYFQPCKDISIFINESDVCSSGSGVSLCMYNMTSNITTNLGTIRDTQMKLLNSGNNEFPVFEIHHNNVTSIINILCVTDSDINFTIGKISHDTEKYYFNLVSPYGCKKEPQYRGLSTGSVLVILFFTFAGMYLIAGAIILKTLRGATGWEMLPNHDFWCELPSLVRDGVVFTFNCCRANSYERI